MLTPLHPHYLSNLCHEPLHTTSSTAPLKSETVHTSLTRRAARTAPGVAILLGSPSPALRCKLSNVSVLVHITKSMW
jgi:hypothetical protein